MGMESIAVIDESGSVALSGRSEPVVAWWSFTKTVLAITALRLVENGSLALDAPIAGERFTLRQLLRHEAGLPDYGSLPEYHNDVAAGKEPWPIDQLLAAAAAERLRYEPGSGWAYSNIGYLKVAQIIERASSLTLGAAIVKFAFDPAGLVTARLATRPTDLVGVQMGPVSPYHPGWVYHGLVVGTVADAARLLRALMHGDLLRSETRAEMLKGRPLPEYRSAINPDPAYGLGLMLRARKPTEHPIGHSGSGPGSRIAVYALHGRSVSIWRASPSSLNVEADAFRLLSIEP